MLDADSHFTTPALPFAEDALEPYMSHQIVDLHYNKHTKGYYKKTNELIEGTAFDNIKAVDELLTKSALLKINSTLYNQAAQAWNHSFFWDSLNSKDQCGEPSKELLQIINKHWKSFDQFKKEVFEKGTSFFGSGWIWLIAKDNELHIKTTPNASNPLANQNETPLFVLDLWEHAYYLQYYNERNKYLENIWNIINWNKVNQRFVK